MSRVEDELKSAQEGKNLLASMVVDLETQLEGAKAEKAEAYIDNSSLANEVKPNPAHHFQPPLDLSLFSFGLNPSNYSTPNPALPVSTRLNKKKLSTPLPSNLLHPLQGSPSRRHGRRAHY